MKIPILFVVAGLLVQLVHTGWCPIAISNQPTNRIFDSPAPSGPIAETFEFNVEQNATARNALGGYHRASVYTQSNCAGWPILDVENFGCGGVCHRLTPSESIYLQQRTTGNPKPTADLYYTYDCKGPHAHAGIWSGQLAGCTGRPNGAAMWLSVYLYFNCWGSWRDDYGSWISTIIHRKCIRSVHFRRYRSSFAFDILDRSKIPIHPSLCFYQPSFQLQFICAIWNFVVYLTG